VSLSTRNILKLKGNESYTDIDLLNGVSLDSHKYVGILGIVVSGEWLLPDNVSGGVVITYEDSRLKKIHEAVLGTFRSAACEKRFRFKLIPNYFVASEDAKRKPWKVHVRITNVHIEEGFSPLALEHVAVVMRVNNVVTKGLRERIIEIGDPNVEKFENVVDEFVDSISIHDSIARARRGLNSSKFVSKKKKNPENFAGNSSKFSNKNALRDRRPEPVQIFRKGVGGSEEANGSNHSLPESALSDAGGERSVSPTVWRGSGNEDPRGSEVSGKWVFSHDNGSVSMASLRGSDEGF
jgi:hypothetical protein